MKAISIHADYATLIAMEIKTIEFRSWETSYRGEILICTSQAYKNNKDYKDAFVFGKAIATAEIVDCMPFNFKKHSENAFVYDKKLKGFSWILDNVKIIEPFDVKGKLKIYEVETNPTYLNVEPEDLQDYWLKNGYIKRLPF